MFKYVIFFDREWNECGIKVSLSGLLLEIMGILEELLKGEIMCGDYVVVRCMSWVLKRVMIREEDMVYCLFGIFDVRMLLLYGEGMGVF